jgi:ATP-binding cassette subfamily B protein
MVIEENRSLQSSTSGKRVKPHFSKANKLLEASKCEILVGDARLENISLRLWRQKTGAVMQDGFIFPETIAENISPGNTHIDEDKLFKAVEMANIREFIEALPLAYNTKIGSNGHGLSEGQKQRLLIARTIYKDPDILLFDEATNSLDAKTRRQLLKI